MPQHNLEFRKFSFYIFHILVKVIYLFTKYLFWAGNYATYWVTASTRHK